ncbi:MAG: hypothetical protein ACR2J8_15370, partial [Thermomicrobiales bacterium]
MPVIETEPMTATAAMPLASGAVLPVTETPLPTVRLAPPTLAAMMANPPPKSPAVFPEIVVVS